MNSDEYATQFVWGIGANNNWYQSEYNKQEGERRLKQYIRLECVEIDVWLDLD